MRLAFGTFLALPEPAEFLGDASYVHHRWKANPTAAFAAELEGQLVGSNFATNWGSVGFFGLFAFAHSNRHVGLYQSFGFWPRFLTAIMAKPVALPPTASPSSADGVRLFSQIPEQQRDSCLRDCRDLTDSLFEGLDLQLEIGSVARQNLGDTVLLEQGATLAGLAVCHVGAGTEAGSGKGYVKFAGVNMGRHEVYRQMLARGYRTQIQGVAMHRDNDPGYNRPGIHLIDDWR